MLILRFFKDAFETTPPDYEVKKFLEEKRKEMGDADFNQKMLYWCGARSYNQFLDYGLLALKIAKFFNSGHWFAFHKVDFGETVIEMTNKLLYDDRHDMYQNVPYNYTDIVLESTEEEKNKILKFFADSLIECFNVAGNGDVAYKSKIGEE